MANLALASPRETAKSEQAYAWMHDRITAHRYRPGYRLVLAKIADELGMSAVPVREAIRRLEAEGLVTFERNVGARVAVVDETDYMHTMQTLGVIEGAATALSAPLLSPDDLDRALALNARMAAMLDDLDPHAFTRLNHQFHAALFASCPNPQLLDQVHRGWRRLSGLRDSTFAAIPERSHESVREHADLVELIRTNADPIEIELATRNHRWRTMNCYLAARRPTHAAGSNDLTTSISSDRQREA